MTLAHGPGLVTSGLQMLIDAANPRSYPGSGTTWYDLSSNAFNLTLNGGPTFNNFGAASYFNFSGTNQWGLTPSFSLPAPFTLAITCAFTTTSTSSEYVITSINTAYPGIVRSGGLLYFFTNTSNGYITTTDPGTNMIDYAFTHNGTTAVIYENGVAVSTGTLPATAIAGGLYIGGYTSVNDTPANIYKTSTYNRALSPQEVVQNFNATRGRYGL